MKHTFKCGIVAESNDALIKPWKDELVRTQRALMYLIVKAGGEVRVPDHVIIKGDPDVSSWEIYRDESTQETVLRVPNSL